MWTLQHWWVNHNGPCHEKRCSKIKPTIIITSKLDANDRSTSSPDHFTTKEITCSTQCRGGEWGPQLICKYSEKRKLCTPVGYWNMNHSAYSPETILTTLFQLPSTYGKLSKWFFTKHGLQMWTTLIKLETGCGCSPWALYTIGSVTCDFAC